MAEPQQGCTCDAFQDALRHFFVEQRETKFWLADKEMGASVIYGPEISHCPFCGTKLVVATKTA